MIEITQCPAQRRTIIYEGKSYYIYMPKHVFVKRKTNLYLYLDLGKWKNPHNSCKFDPNCTVLFPNVDACARICLSSDIFYDSTIEEFWSFEFVNHRNHFEGNIEDLTKPNWWTNCKTTANLSFFWDKDTSMEHRKLFKKNGVVNPNVRIKAEFERENYFKTFLIANRNIHAFCIFCQNDNYSPIFNYFRKYKDQDQIQKILTIAANNTNRAFIRYFLQHDDRKYNWDYIACKLTYLNAKEMVEHLFSNG